MRTDLPRLRSKRGFTLLEMLVTVTLTLLIVILLSNMAAIVSKTWQQADTRITSFENARFAFERITRTLSQATLNPYWDYVDASGNRRTAVNASTFVPASYARCSDQDFLIAQTSTFSSAGRTWACFFQSPLGFSNNQSLTPLDNLLNATGFFVEFNNDADPATLSMKPSYIAAAKWRFRLMQLLQPAESLSVFSSASAGANQWVTNAMNIASNNRQARPIADNIIALVFLAEDSSGNPLPTASPAYAYDSRNQLVPSTWNQLPAQVQVMMIAIDEGSAQRLAAINGATAPALVNSAYFTNPSSYDSDLTALKGNLTANSAHLTYRVFNTTVRIESAQWSN